MEPPGLYTVPPKAGDPSVLLPALLMPMWVLLPLPLLHTYSSAPTAVLFPPAAVIRGRSDSTREEDDGNIDDEDCRLLLICSFTVVFFVSNVL